MQDSQWVPPPPPAQPMTNVPNYLWWAILSTIALAFFCCFGLPIGIVAIVNATQVDKKLLAGDLAGAMAASKNAKTWSVVSTVLVGVGLVLTIAIFALGIIGALLEK